MQKRTFGLKLIAGTLVLSLGISSIPAFGNAQNVYAATSENDFDIDAATGLITAYKGSDQNISIPDKIKNVSVNGIEWGVFSTRNNLREITLPASATTIGAMAFEACTDLSGMNIPAGTTVIAPYTYYGCSDLEQVTIPSSVQSIMLEAFGGCTRLSTVTIPQGVTTIEDEAFAGCSSLRRVELPESVTSIGKDVFKNCNGSLTIAAPAGSYAEAYANQMGLSYEETAGADDLSAANSVIDMINRIGTVTLDSESAVTAARNAYDSLTDVQKNLVSNYHVLTQAEDTLQQLKNENRDEQVNQTYANAVIKKIDAIGTVTLDSEDAITAARDAYDALTSAQKKLVSNYNTLLDAEEALRELKEQGDNDEQSQADRLAANTVMNLISRIGFVTLNSEVAINDARSAYDALTDAQKKLVLNYDILTRAESSFAELKAQYDQAQSPDEADLIAATAVINAIDAIGTVTLNSESVINSARHAYEALTTAQKALVTNHGTLTLAENRLAQLKAEYEQQQMADLTAAASVVSKISQIGTVTLNSEAAITAARTAYNNLTATQKAMVTNYQTLTQAEYTLGQLKDAADLQAALNVTTAIADIGTVTLDKLTVITNAREAYDALTNVQKALVSNYDALTAAEATLAQLKNENPDAYAAAVVIANISKIGTVTLNSEAAITSARKAYDALTDNQKRLVTNYTVLTTAEATLAQLKASHDVATKLTVSKLKYTLYTKGSKTVTLTVSDSGTRLAGASVTWKSSNPKVATVKNGKVTAKKKGKTTISATYKGITVKTTITVKKPTLKLKKTKATIKRNKTFKINATAKPAKKITYKSANTKIATVSKKGVIKAKKKGKTKIQVKANGVKKYFTITVK